METLVATVLIIVIFVIASMILNNLFGTAVKNNTSEIETYLNEMQYQYINDKIDIPYQDTYKQWNVSIYNIKEESNDWVVFEAHNAETKKQVKKSLLSEVR